jgi:hypothetical protein
MACKALPIASTVAVQVFDWCGDMDYEQYDNSARPAGRTNVGRMRRLGH